MGGQAGQGAGCSWIEIWKGTKKKSGEISSYCWPLLPYTSTNLTSNHSDHCLGVCLQLAPICGRLHSSPGVAEALTALKWPFCFKYGAQRLYSWRDMSRFPSDGDWSGLLEKWVVETVLWNSDILLWDPKQKLDGMKEEGRVDANVLPLDPCRGNKPADRDE